MFWHYHIRVTPIVPSVHLHHRRKRHGQRIDVQREILVHRRRRPRLVLLLLMVMLMLLLLTPRRHHGHADHRIQYTPRKHHPTITTVRLWWPVAAILAVVRVRILSDSLESLDTIFCARSLELFFLVPGYFVAVQIKTSCFETKK